MSTMTAKREAAAPLPLAAMSRLAAMVRDELAPHCAAIEIAGSVRRQRERCGDIDIVLLPRPGADITKAALRLAGADGALLTNGQISKRVLLRKSGVQCDLWIAHHGKDADMLGQGGLPPNFAALLMTYTGSPGHNIRLVGEAEKRGWQWKPQTGLVIPPLWPDHDAPEIVCASERAIYDRLGIRWMEPPDRDAWGAGAGLAPGMTRPEFA